MSSAQIPIRLWIAFFTGRPWRGRMPPRGCSLPGSPRRCGAETGRILYDGALWRPITYGRLLLLLEPPAAGGSIVISGHFSARMSSQVSEFPGVQKAVGTVGNKIQEFETVLAPGPAGSGPKREGRPAGRCSARVSETVPERLRRRAGGSKKPVWIVAGLVFPERPHALYDLSLCVQSGMGLVVGSLQ